MKNRNMLILSLLASMAFLSACDNSSGGGGGGNSGDSQDDGKITVSFYIDFNYANANKEWNISGGNSLETYDVQRVENGSKVTKPADPTTAPFPEFPVFLGWSKKEVIDSKSDLWNFDTDTINTETKTFSLYGCWAAEGEN